MSEFAAFFLHDLGLVSMLTCPPGSESSECCQDLPVVPIVPAADYLSAVIPAES